MSTVASPASPFEFFAGLALPDVVPVAIEAAAVLVHPDGSWARQHVEGDLHLITQGGPRRLWDEVERAYDRWQELGEPHRSRFGITVDPYTQELWLDYPDSPHKFPLQVP